MPRVALSFRRFGVLPLLLAVNCVVFVYMAVCLIAARSGNGGAVAWADWLVLPGSLEGCLRRPWSLLTYMTAHIDFLHLLFNMLWLLWFGGILQAEAGAKCLLKVYVGGGLSGGVLFLLLCATTHGLCGGSLLGASASVLAIMTVVGCLVPDMTLHLFFIGDVKMKWIVAAMALLALLGVGAGDNLGGAIAHAGGIVFGLAYALSLRLGDARHKKQAKKPKDPKRPTASGARRTARIMQRRLDDTQQLDRLLDKIKRAGYESLTRSERKELDEISKRLNKTEN